MRILFVSKHNSFKSIIAAAYLNLLSKQHEGISAGLAAKDKEKVDSLVVECMLEENIDLSGNTKTQLTSDLVKNSDKIILIGLKDEKIPSYIDKNMAIEWDIADFPTKSLEFHRKLRDKIKDKVEDLVSRIG